MAGNIAFRVGTGVALICVESGAAVAISGICTGAGVAVGRESVGSGAAVTRGCAAPGILRSGVLGGAGAVVSEGGWDVPVAGGQAGAGVVVGSNSNVGKIDTTGVGVLVLPQAAAIMSTIKQNRSAEDCF